MYENLKKGISLIFIGELGAIIFETLAAFFQSNMWVTLACGIIAIACGVITLVGLGKAGKQSEGIHTAFQWQIAVIVLTVAYSILSVALPNVQWFSYINVFVIVAEMLTYFYIINDCNAIMESQGKPEIAKTGKSVWKLIVICVLIEFAVLLAMTIIIATTTDVAASQAVMVIILLVAVIAYAVLNVIYNIKYLIYLKKVSNNL